ncbi:MAG: TraB/GumN family protein [Sphingobacteriaceae bacterium]|nr:TraB/GumN family protein [Sphingobacteriaceae bacterium]
MKNVLLSFFILVLSVNANAQNKNKSSAKPGLFWEISGRGLKEPSYLFGTYHLVGKNFLDTLPATMEYFKKATAVVGEVVMESEMAMVQKLMPMMLLKDNSLDKVLSANEYSEVDSFIKTKTSMDLSMLNGLKPAAVQIMLVALIAPKNVSPENPGLDTYFQTQATAAGKKVLGLETLEEQGLIMFNQPLPRQKELLLKTVRESNRMIQESEKLFEDYKRQDLKAIENAFLDSKDYTPEEMDVLLTKRNNNWIKIMPGMMAKGPVFFAVGAGHLVGNKGLIALLKASGYTVKPLAVR